MAAIEQKKIVLILDDEIKSEHYDGLRRNMENVIKTADTNQYEPLIETDSRKGLSLIINHKEHNIVLVFLDRQFKNQQLQGENILQEMRRQNIDIPVIVFSYLTRDRRSKELRDVIQYERKDFNMEKNEFASYPENVGNLIIRSQLLANPDCTLVINCADKKIRVNSTKFSNNPIFKYKFKDVSPSFMSDDIALNADTFLFKVIFIASKNGNHTAVNDCFPGTRIFKDLSKDFQKASVLIKKEKIDIKNNPRLDGISEKDATIIRRGAESKKVLIAIMDTLSNLHEPPPQLIALVSKYRKSQSMTDLFSLYNFLKSNPDGKYADCIETIESATEEINYTKIISRFNEDVRKESDNRILELIRGGSEQSSGSRGSGRPTKGSGVGSYRLLAEKSEPENCEEGIQSSSHSNKGESSAFVTLDDFMKLQERVTLLEKEVKLLKKQK